MSIGATDYMLLSGIVGGVMDAWGGYTQGSQQKQAYEFNADLAMERAQQTRTAEALHQTQMERAKQATTGVQKGQYAGRGVKTNTGSPVDVMVDSLSQWNLDMAISGYNAEVSARGLENQAAIDRWTGAQAKKEAGSQAAMSLFSSAVEFAILTA